MQLGAVSGGGSQRGAAVSEGGSQRGRMSEWNLGAAVRRWQVFCVGVSLEVFRAWVEPVSKPTPKLTLKPQ